MIKSRALIMVIIVLSLFTVACNSGDKTGKSGREKMTIQKKISSDGVLVSEISMKDGVKHGLTKNYYASGKVQSVVNFVEGKQEGETIWYYENGKPYQVTPFINGQEHGIQKKYYQSGKPLAEVTYINGQLQPDLREYKETGELVTDYPEIVFEGPLKGNVPGRYILKMYMSDNSREVVFEQRIVNSAGDTSLAKVPTTEGVGEIPFFVDKGKTVMAQVHIQAKTRTKLKNVYLTENQYLVKIINK